MLWNFGVAVGVAVGELAEQPLRFKRQAVAVAVAPTTLNSLLHRILVLVLRSRSVLREA